jgi:flagellar biosynthesis/type III secretory pathway chaperone
MSRPFFCAVNTLITDSAITKLSDLTDEQKQVLYNWLENTDEGTYSQRREEEHRVGNWFTNHFDSQHEIPEDVREIEEAVQSLRGTKQQAGFPCIM